MKTYPISSDLQLGFRSSKTLTTLNFEWATPIDYTGTIPGLEPGALIILGSEMSYLNNIQAPKVYMQLRLKYPIRTYRSLFRLR